MSVFVGTPASMYSVATLAARPSFASLKSGTIVHVLSQKSYYKSSSSGYIRLPVADPTWLTVPAWIILDAGNVEADGVTSPIPFAEWLARTGGAYGIPFSPPQRTVVTFQDTVMASDLICSLGVLTGNVVFQGTRTSVATGTIGARIARAKATNVFTQITDLVQTWGPLVGKKGVIVTSASGNVGATFTVTVDLGAGVAEISTLEYWNDQTTFNAPTEKIPAVGDTYMIFTGTRLTGRTDIIQVLGGGNVTSGDNASKFQLDSFEIENNAAIEIDSLSGPNGNFTFTITNCRYLNINAVMLANVLEIGCVATNLGGYISPGYVFGTNTLYGNVFFGPLTLRAGVVTLLSGGTAFIGSAAIIDSFSDTTFLDCAFRGWSLGAVRVWRGTVILGTTSCLWGSSSVAGSYAIDHKLGIVAVNTASMVTACPITGQLAGTQDFKISGATSCPPYDPTTRTFLAPITNTFAHFDAAAGATGFGQGVSNPAIPGAVISRRF